MNQANVLEFLGKPVVLASTAIQKHLNFIYELSSEIKFYENTSHSSGTWQQMLREEPIFILAEIANYDCSAVENSMHGLMQDMDTASTISEKIALVELLSDLMLGVFSTLNSWVLRSNKNHDSLVAANFIEEFLGRRVRSLFCEFYSYELAKDASKLNTKTSTYHHYSASWNLKNIPANEQLNNELKELGSKREQVDHLFKKYVVICKPILTQVKQLGNSAPITLERYLKTYKGHKPHIGLLLSCIDLLSFVQNDLNEIPKRHLDFYFKELLKEVERGQILDVVPFYVELQRNVVEKYIPKGTLIKAGQTDTGSNRMYSLLHDSNFSPVEIVGLHTLFTSTNELIEIKASFRTVSGIYSNILDKSIYNKSNEISPATAIIGEEQLLRTDANRTMIDTELGLIIASPLLFLEEGERLVSFTLNFSGAEFRFFTDLLLDIAKTQQISAEEVFSNLFNNAFEGFLTTAKGWLPISNLKVVSPKDWSSASFSILLQLNKAVPAITALDVKLSEKYEELPNYPVFKLKINQNAGKYVYSFLQFLVFEKIIINTKVKGLKSLVGHGPFGPLDMNSDVALFGPTPQLGSTIMVGHPEIFVKPLTKIKLSWEYVSLPQGTNFKKHYEAYSAGIDTGSFKAKLTVLDDYTFKPLNKEIAQEFNIFKEDEKGVLQETELTGINLDLLAFLPETEIEKVPRQYTSKSKNGFFKLELSAPAFAFGHKVYPSVYNEVVTANTVNASKGKNTKVKPLPSEPFVPSIRNMQIAYEAASIINFDQNQKGGVGSSSNECVWQMNPFGYKTLVRGKRLFGKEFVPKFKNEGEFFIGLSNAVPGNEINLLFELETQFSYTLEQVPKLQMYYLVNNEWMRLEPRHRLLDTTKGLIKSGLLKFILPEGCSLDNTILPKNVFWIKLSMEANSKYLGYVKKIFVNGTLGIRVKEEKESEQEPEVTIKKETLETFSPIEKGILNVVQPFASFGGFSKESQVDYYHRVSALLRHKNRPLSLEDIEQSIAAKFPWLTHIKGFGPNNSQLLVAGDLVVAAVPRRNSDGSLFQIQLSYDDVTEITTEIAPLLHPSQNVRVVNPIAEKLFVKMSVAFSGADTGMFIKLFNTELDGFLTPWRFQKGSALSYGNQILKADIFNFILSRPYIMHATGISVIQIKNKIAGGVFVIDSAVNNVSSFTPGLPWAFFSSDQASVLNIINSQEYIKPTQATLSELATSDGMLISDKNEVKRQTKAETVINKEDSTEDLELTITL